ncbi:prepilin-type N-terminal cleavage/methylation domain-containing protein [Patescibacteria group bacterium]
MFIIQRRQAHKNNFGFSLIEVIIAVAIGITAALVLTTTSINGLDEIRSARQRERLHSNAIYITDTLTHWIKQSASIFVPDPQTLEITVPNPMTTKTIALNGTEITLDTVPVTTHDIEVTNLVFIQLERSVQINFTLKSANSDETFSAQTTVAKRSPL